MNVAGNVNRAQGAQPMLGDISQASIKSTVQAYAYWDVIGVWHNQPLSEQQLRWLSGETRPLIKPPYLLKGRARFDASYVMYTRLHQPSKAALEWLAKREGVLITYVEASRDTIYSDEYQARATGQLFNKSLVQLRHRKRRSMIFVEGANGCTGLRKPGPSFMWYTTKPSKITGEDCFHFEARLCGSKTIRKAGIVHPRDLLTFDHGEFWQRMWARHLRMVSLSHERLGRYQDNRLKGTKRRLSTYDDFRRGALLHRIHGQAGEGGFSMQGVFDHFGRAPFIQHDIRLICPEILIKPELAYPMRRW